MELDEMQVGYTCLTTLLSNYAFFDTNLSDTVIITPPVINVEGQDTDAHPELHIGKVHVPTCEIEDTSEIDTDDLTTKALAMIMSDNEEDMDGSDYSNESDFESKCDDNSDVEDVDPNVNIEENDRDVRYPDMAGDMNIPPT
ncbi:hypothetical protein LOTGIDRAFT_155040 [Lottia gigantea]|uniref:Uncharacterized protein n=1 Tax=Lottia gigantea TaxID=225164 RepID=V4B9G6_LOTGI|nr:hypothetical protein LOTGIDRAFT_155040 [Lottia gigantea]ESO85554.1 hypothetical protein LOTGIDRAFT_155040 [Lottia gigantea]